MNFNEFKEALFESIKVAASAETTTTKEEFLVSFSETLIDAEEIDGFEYISFEGVGRKSKKMQIDGYSYNELDEVLTLFISPPISFINESVLTNSDAEKLFKRAQAFIEDADYIVENGEESTPGYDLAKSINHGDFKIRKYSIYLLTDMSMSNRIRELKASNFQGIPLEYHIWDIARLFQLVNSKTGKEEIVIDMGEFTNHGLPCLPASETDDYESFLCNIPGIVLAQLYNKYGGRLLEGNVRSFLQTKGKVNKGIRNTILNNPSMFFAYNNGIAATAFGVSVEDYEGIAHIKQIEGLQIVNGGQTTASLAMALENDKKDGAEEKIKEIYVPMKLSILSPEKAQEIIPNISRYANSQNKVSDADLWSNHPFHVRMEEFSRRIFAPAVDGRQFQTRWYYERANGQYKQEVYKSTLSEKKKFELQNPPSQLFKKTDLAKLMNIYLLRPEIACAGGQKSFANFATLVSKEWERDDTSFNEEYFKRIVSLQIIFKRLDKLVKNQSWYNSYKANIVAYTMARILEEVKKNHKGYAVNFKKIWQTQNLSEHWIEQLTGVSKVMYLHLVDDKRPVENVTEWSKKEACWTQAKDITCPLSAGFISELIDEETQKEEKREARKDQKENNKISAMVTVVEYGLENWQYLLEWDEDHRILSGVEKEIVKVTKGIECGRLPSEKQCIRLLEILDRARGEGFSK